MRNFFNLFVLFFLQNAAMIMINIYSASTSIYSYVPEFILKSCLEGSGTSGKKRLAKQLEARF